MHNYVEVWGWLVWGRSVHFFDPFYSPYSFNFVVAAKQQIKRIRGVEEVEGHTKNAPTNPILYKIINYTEIETHL